VAAKQNTDHQYFLEALYIILIGIAERNNNVLYSNITHKEEIKIYRETILFSTTTEILEVEGL
jgi:hypothetical protein